MNMVKYKSKNTNRLLQYADSVISKIIYVSHCSAKSQHKIFLSNYHRKSISDSGSEEGNR